VIAFITDPDGYKIELIERRRADRRRSLPGVPAARTLRSTTRPRCTR
jgi:hypothetical protein